MQAVTAGLIAALSDIIAQKLSPGKVGGPAINWRRTLAIALYGMTWTGSFVILPSSQPAHAYHW
jgi:hypothetical protein